MQTTAPRKILVIEDDEQLRVTLVIALEDVGYSVQVSASGDEGLRLAREHRPALIVCDVHLPVGDGRSLLATVRQDEELSSCQFVLMTGDVKGATLRAGMDLGADDYLAKPFTIHEFLHCVEARFRRAEIYRRAEEHAMNWLRDTVAKKLPHELFTPLSGILGLSELLRDDLGNVPANVARDMVADIQRSAECLHRSLKNYLTILELREEIPKGVAPGETTAAAEIAGLLQRTATRAVEAHRREKDLTLDCAELALPIAPHNLTAVVTELIDNACKYSKRDTPIVLRLRGDKHEAELAVIDHGRGMSPEQIARVGAFHQFDRNKYEQQGLGLGLTLAQHLIERNGGVLLIESVPGQRTRVIAKWLRTSGRT